MKNKLKEDWCFFLIALVTLSAGTYLVANANLFYDKSTYAFIINKLNDLVMTVPMIFLGGLAMLAWFFDLKTIKRLCLPFIQLLWMFFTVAYLWMAFQGDGNLSWVLALNLSLAIFFEAWGGHY